MPVLKIVDNTYTGNGDLAVTINDTQLINNFGGFKKIVGGGSLRDTF